LRALAVTSTQPSTVAPGLPTVATTVPGYESVGISGLFAPARTPAATIMKLNEPVVRYLRTPEARELFLKNGAETVGSTPQELATTIKSEMQRLGKVIKDNDIRGD
jgi:tripartite-type tricarboxylate transporter receptor subunit TctC